MVGNKSLFDDYKKLKTWVRHMVGNKSLFDDYKINVIIGDGN